MNFSTRKQRGSARLAVIASAIALVVLGSITFANRTPTTSAPAESQPVESSGTHALEFQSHLPPISPTAEPDSVYHYQ